MSVPLQQYSEDQIGIVWTIESHAYLCHVMAEIESTWKALYELAVIHGAPVGIKDL